METVFQKIKEKLGCKSDTVHSQLQKLIIHEESDVSAKTQCSSIDEPYATVIVQLPSLFTGKTPHHSLWQPIKGNSIWWRRFQI